ncbi:Dysbindin [Amphibalanus amphitrite]|uniref:Dysbindin n=1 Tax=Amphibalanus amphitrite TaxID=1232801 RepID=A0A6A4WQD6_AMPAM|nr:Dysbindin [Amphibalanus amphitrite]KAF0309687.1 Dysbindin [Amphibalanus amphitrite]
MFSSFRDRLKAVQNDVILGLQRLTAAEPQRTGSPTADDDVAAVAGARLLSLYQDQWSRMHTNSERAVTAVDKLNTHVVAVRRRCQTEHAGMVELHRRLTALPEMAAKVHGMLATVASLQAEFAEAETQLAELEHQAAMERLEDRKMRERAKLEAYRRARQRQLDELKISVAQEHLDRVSELERRRRSEQAERYSTFDQLAHQELEHFRRHHSLDVVRPVSGRPAQQLSLEDVDISREADAAALAEFLADTELDPEDPAAELDSNPEDPARDIDSNPEDPAGEEEPSAVNPAGDIDYSPEDPAMNIYLSPRKSSIRSGRTKEGRTEAEESASSDTTAGDTL